ncbi:MAG: MOSC domain-containing protein [Planctomycetota bacterium]
MDVSPVHLGADELEIGLTAVLQSPREQGQLQAIFVRPAENERQSLDEAELAQSTGIVGDRWVHAHWQHLPDGSSDPDTQVSLMNARILEQISGGDAAAMGLAGDNLIVDFDLSEENLPVGSELAIGDEVIIKISETPHTGCRKFVERYGKPAQQFVNSDVGKQHHLRGVLGMIVSDGTIRVGDAVRKK